MDGCFFIFIVIGLLLGLLNIIIKEDIECVELIFGFNVMFYGFNVYNGLLNMIIKDLRILVGIMIVINLGVFGDGKGFFFGWFCYV